MEKLKEDLLKLLCENAKYTNAQMATMLGAKEEAVAAAVKELEKSGVIVKYSAILDTEVLAENSVQALIEVKWRPRNSTGSILTPKKFIISPK